MNFIIRWYKIDRFLRDQWKTVVSFCICIFLFFLVLIFYQRYNAQKKDLELLTREVQLLKDRADTLKQNMSLTQDQIKTYNALLASLIPETEDYFSIIYALEEISKSTGFIITNYNISVAKTSPENIVLNVDGTGDADAFLNFLRDYQFVGGRLVTSDKIQFSGGKNAGTKIALTFYNKHFAFNETVQVPAFTAQEIAKLEDIKSKIHLDFSVGTYQTVDTDYSSKTDPFTSLNN